LKNVFDKKRTIQILFIAELNRNKNKKFIANIKNIHIIKYLQKI